jgi:heptosyltransferase-3
MVRKPINRILIYRLGSIGDFIIALPCLHLIRKCHPNAEIVLLTALPIDQRAAPAAEVLEHTGLIDKYIYYPPRAPVLSKVLAIKKHIKSIAPDLFVYLTQPRGIFSIYRDYVFFRWCGIPSIRGFPLAGNLHTCRTLDRKSHFREREAHRLGRCLASSYGIVDVEKSESWDLHLSSDEEQTAERILRDQLLDDFEKLPLLGISVGTKQKINDWGDANWRAVLNGLSTRKFALVFVGSGDDFERSEKLGECWPMPRINLCGRLSPRVSAAVLRRVSLFLCHDSGPMHLAAAIGTRCIAVFSRNNPPGIWYPFGSGHKIFYPESEGASIETILPSEVTAAAIGALDEEQRSLCEKLI